MSASDHLAFILGEATLTLYPTTAGGDPVLASPIWFGACVNRVQVAERWIKSESRPSGRAYPKRRAFVPQYEINIDRLWVTRKASPTDFRTTHQEYVLDLLM